ncbi:MAG: hypothetical protein LIR46_13460 [Bacteroidota bacterium]|nr:hypothetical protein [Bacteroidota bacterium]
MRKFLMVLALAIGLLFLGIQPAEAQLGGLLKKAKKAIFDVTAVAGGAEVGVAAVTLPGGGTMQNPVASVADVQLVGVFGKSTSTNYGEVYLVLKVKMIANKTNISIGGNSDLPPIMIDQAGNSYKMPLGWYDYDVVEGVYVTLVLNEHATFKDVRKSAVVLQQVRIGIIVDSDNRGLLTFKNVPVLWDVDPETVLQAQ